MTTSLERRQNERLPAGSAIRIRFKTPQDFEEYYLRDISHGGMFIASQRLQPVGSLLTLLVQLPGGDEIRLQARVVHLRTASQVAPGAPAGMGVAFDDLPADAAQRISSCVERIRASQPPSSRLKSGPPRSAPPISAEDLELLRRLCWVLARGSLSDRPLEEVLGVPGAASVEARRDAFRRLRRALGLDRPPAFLASEDRWELERKLRVIETIVDMTG